MTQDIWFFLLAASFPSLFLSKLNRELLLRCATPSYLRSTSFRSPTFACIIWHVQHVYSETWQPLCHHILKALHICSAYGFFVPDMISMGYFQDSTGKYCWNSSIRFDIGLVDGHCSLVNGEAFEEQQLKIYWDTIFVNRLSKEVAVVGLAIQKIYF